jgi:hypothetical protein
VTFRINAEITASAMTLATIMPRTSPKAPMRKAILYLRSSFLRVNSVAVVGDRSPGGGIQVRVGSSASGSGLLDAITRPWPSLSVIVRLGSAATRALYSLRAMERRRSATELGVSEVILPLGCRGRDEKNPGQERARGPQRRRKTIRAEPGRAPGQGVSKPTPDAKPSPHSVASGSGLVI